jgi:hypothetical protein
MQAKAKILGNSENVIEISETVARKYSLELSTMAAKKRVFF